jgi:hypothetical protein
LNSDIARISPFLGLLDAGLRPSTPISPPASLDGALTTMRRYRVKLACATICRRNCVIKARRSVAGRLHHLQLPAADQKTPGDFPAGGFALIAAWSLTSAARSLSHGRRVVR